MVVDKTIEIDRLKSQLQAELKAREDTQAEVDRLLNVRAMARACRGTYSTLH